jgi:hypothetical protein
VVMPKWRILGIYFKHIPERGDFSFL